MKIKSYYGTSENAVSIQIWIAVCVYLILAIAKKKFKIKESLYIISQILEFCIFEKVPINELFTNKNMSDFIDKDHNQLTLF